MHVDLINDRLHLGAVKPLFSSVSHFLSLLMENAQIQAQVLT